MTPPAKMTNLQLLEADTEIGRKLDVIQLQVNTGKWSAQEDIDARALLAQRHDIHEEMALRGIEHGVPLWRH